MRKENDSGRTDRGSYWGSIELLFTHVVFVVCDGLTQAGTGNQLGFCVKVLCLLCVCSHSMRCANDLALLAKGGAAAA
jgi:hypothetical protein